MFDEWLRRVERSLGHQPAALELLGADREQLDRSRRLIRSARAICARADQALALPTPFLGLSCTVAGCGDSAPFRPCFVVEHGDRRVLVREGELRVCSRHRAHLDALFRRVPVLAALRRKLRERGRDEPDAVHVLFELVDRARESG